MKISSDMWFLRSVLAYLGILCGFDLAARASSFAPSYTIFTSVFLLAVAFIVYEDKCWDRTYAMFIKYHTTNIICNMRLR